MLHGTGGQHEEYLTTQGIGRPTILPFWYLNEPQEAKFEGPLRPKSLLLPYSATPPPQLGDEKIIISDKWLENVKASFGNLWSLPFDHRLDFIFQNVDVQVAFGQHPAASTPQGRTAMRLNERLMALERNGGSFAVYDIDDHGSSAEYSVSRRYSAMDAEEIFLKIPPSQFSVHSSSSNLNFSFQRPHYVAPWRRLM